MARKAIFLFMAISLLCWWFQGQGFVQSKKNAQRLPAVTQVTESIKSAAPERTQAPMALGPIQHVTRVRPKKLQARDITPSSRAGFEQGGERWRWVDGLVAVAEGTQGIDRALIKETRPGFWLLSGADLPVDTPHLKLVQREDNGLLGIYTGVIRAMGKGEAHAAQPWRSDCPAQVVESYPALDSVLLRAPAGVKDDELSGCLRHTNLFKRVEWEILDRPRGRR